MIMGSDKSAKLGIAVPSFNILAFFNIYVYIKKGLLPCCSCWCRHELLVLMSNASSFLINRGGISGKVIVFYTVKSLSAIVVLVKVKQVNLHSYKCFRKVE